MLPKPPVEDCGIALPKLMAARPPVYVVECHTCGFEPENQASVFLGRCPRCHGFSWQRVLQTRGEAASGYDEIELD